MATRKPKAEERLDEISLERAIDYIENQKGTKKGACEILNISYNTTRLDKLITVYKEKKEREKIRRQENRGKPATDNEKKYVVSNYLAGESVLAISKTLFRGVSFVSSVLDELNVPKRRNSYSYFSPELIPEETMRNSFSVDEVVYSARYDSLAKIRREFAPGIYSVYLLGEKWKQFAYQPAEELASLEHLKEYLN